MTAYDQLAHPPVEGLDRESCEYLAYEDSRILTAINVRAGELFATYDGEAAFAIVVLRELAERIKASAAAYRQAQHQVPRWPPRR